MTETTLDAEEARAKRREKLIAKIKLMQALVDRSTTPEGERLAALATIRRLSDQFAISVEDIEAAAELEIIDIILDFSEPLHTSRLYVLIVFGKAVDFCNCKLLTLTRIDDPSQAPQGLRIVGSRMDAEVARAATTFLMDQIKGLLRAFHKDVKAAYKAYADAYEARWRAADYFGADDFDRKRRQRLVNSFQPAEDEELAGLKLKSILDAMSKDAPATFALTLRDFAFADKAVIQKVARALFVSEPQMPGMNDDAWTAIESDWGLGFSSRFAERLETELKNVDGEDEETDDEETDDYEALLPYVPGDREFNEIVQNLPAKATGTAVAIIGDRVRDDKFRRINDFLAKDDIGVVQADVYLNDSDITNLGRERANAVDLSALREAKRKPEEK